VLASSTAAIADKDYPTSVINDAGSPVTLTKCEAWARDINKTILYSHASVPNVLFDLGIAFTNTSDKPVTALRVETVSYDAFNTVLRTGQLDTQQDPSADKLSVAPGASFDLLGPKSWHGGNDLTNRDRVSCKIIAVKFADGTVWTALDRLDLPPSAPSSGSTAPGASPPTPAPQVLLDVEGSGYKTTQRFQVPNEWAIAWSYDCSNLGNPGFFGIKVQGDAVDLVVDQVGASGRDVSYQHAGGSVYLEIGSGCSWHIRAVVR
jgi:hypothetical protein